MLSFLLSLGLGFGAIDLDELPMTQVQSIVNEVVQQLDSSLSVKPSVVVSNRKDPTPLGAISYTSGRCVIVINPNPDAWAQWGRFLNADNKPNWQEIIAASAAHEVGHCMRESRQFVTQFTVQDPQHQALSGSAQLSGSHESVFKQELFADAVALIYAREFAGPNAEPVVEAMINSRERFADNDPTHSTGAYLKALKSMDVTRHAAESMGQAASRLLNDVSIAAL
ncbi:hypothetical protein NQT62_00025 [Limnobacter humi]|uniref:Uncharacterized protein n=1 Tax=Limnobacter humi TaxID=1778671 RepID=A0ABT1WBS7_9BURK|nr:hypothetical protein [Limnobacter humi]MCQ8894824.1 hypothetical protein [Limnobacter humi]